MEQRKDGTLFPVEFKIGRRREWENDDVQLCAQALCMEEMFGAEVSIGAVFHAQSKRRREVAFTPELRSATEQAVKDLREVLCKEYVPPAAYKTACEECSLFEVCLPKATGERYRAMKLTKALFEV